MPPGILDVFTHIDDLLRQLIQESRDHNNALINALADRPDVITGIKVPEEPSRHLPFVDEVTLVTARTTELLISADAEQGLEAPAQSGYIINDGGGEVWCSIYDGITAYSKEHHMYSGEYIGFRRGDDVFIDALKLRTDTDGTVVRVILSR